MTVLVARKHADSARRQVVRTAPRCRHLAAHSHRRTTSGSGQCRVTWPQHDGLVDAGLVDGTARDWSDVGLQEDGQVEDVLLIDNLIIIIIIIIIIIVNNNQCGWVSELLATDSYTNSTFGFCPANQLSVVSTKLGLSPKGLRNQSTWHQQLDLLAMLPTKVTQWYLNVQQNTSPNITKQRDVTVLARREMSAARPPHAPGRLARRQRYVRRQTTTKASQQNNTGPLGGPITNHSSSASLPISCCYAGSV